MELRERGSFMRYAVVIEKGKYYYGAYVPDLPECSAVGKTVEETRELIYNSISNHLGGLEEEGNSFPSPKTICEYVEIN
jgi:predicted RNase H-like HicB family nuclease